MYRVLVVGGDKRNVYLADVLNRDSFSVSVCGFDEDICFENNIKRAYDVKDVSKESDIIVLPLPVSFDGITFNTPLSREFLYIRDVFNYAKKDAIIVGGRISDDILKKHENIVDYAKRDDFAYLNAVPTAEGAIEAAMKETPLTIKNSLCMVTGFGKCSEILSVTLKALGAKVHVYARSAKDLSHADALGFKTYHMNRMQERIENYDMIFNTVPFGIFESECVDKIKPSCTFIDIASAPGGISENADKEKINYHFLPGIPGKYSPYTAAEIIKNVILTIMRESGKDAYGWLLRD